jgi:aspartyl-tRNA(Asn)/glutamyl-tRNA(Gln) amidotransferase subunit B
LALECEIAHTSIFARKNYFYPDLPKGYQISQYEQPLARNGKLLLRNEQGSRLIRIRRLHIEEDTGKSIHIYPNGEEDSGEGYSLVDLNRAGIPLLEIVTEPDLRTAEEVRTFATVLRTILQYLDVNSGDMQKGVLRIEPNVSMRPVGSDILGTRTEVKNLNSFRALEKSVAFEIKRQTALLRQGKQVVQETVGWDEVNQSTVSQRGKEEAHDYRYFPEPDLPPLVIDGTWIEKVRASLPELPEAKINRFRQKYGLKESHSEVLVADKSVANFFEETVLASKDIEPKSVANWIAGELFGLMNQAGMRIKDIRVIPENLGTLIQMVTNGVINKNTGKKVLTEMFQTGASPENIVETQKLSQISDKDFIEALVQEVLEKHSEEVQDFLEGNEVVINWLFGQVMRQGKGRANTQMVKKALNRQLENIKKSRERYRAPDSELPL